MGKKSILLFLLALFSHIAGAQEWKLITVMSYNIHITVGLDKNADIERIAKIIQDAKPDVVALQEVDRNTERSPVDQAEELARLTGMTVEYGKALDFQGGEYGIAVLSKLKIKRSTKHLLPNTPGHEQRVALEVEFEEPNFTLLATHLDHVANSPDRLAAVPVFEKIVRNKAHHPFVIAGDFNATFDKPEMTAFRRVWTFAGFEKELFSIPADNPSRWIDFIGYYPKDGWEEVSIRILDEPVASDHLPVVAELRFLD